MTEITETGMINLWHTKMFGDIVRYSGGPVPESTALIHPIGKRLKVTIHGTDEEIAAFKEGLQAGLMAEIWIAESGKFA